MAIISIFWFKNVIFQTNQNLSLFSLYYTRASVIRFITRPDHQHLALWCQKAVSKVKQTSQISQIVGFNKSYWICLGPVDALPSSTSEWAQYYVTDEMKEGFQFDKSDAAINKQNFTCAGLTVFYLLVGLVVGLLKCFGFLICTKNLTFVEGLK